jgi:hypothetical protein
MNSNYSIVKRYTRNGRVVWDLFDPDGHQVLEIVAHGKERAVGVYDADGNQRVYIGPSLEQLEQQKKEGQK